VLAISDDAEPFRGESVPFLSAPVVRVARSDDAESLAALSGALGYPTSACDMAQRLSLVLSAADHCVLVAQRGDGAVVGWVHVCARPLIQVERQAEIEGLVVAPTVRRRGIGRRLMEAAEDWAWGAGCRHIALRTNVVRAGARDFYESLGYRLTKTQWTLQKEHC
jgi:GNAT superfamily N-acetyltransferase